MASINETLAVITRFVAPAYFINTQPEDSETERINRNLFFLSQIRSIIMLVGTVTYSTTMIFIFKNDKSHLQNVGEATLVISPWLVTLCSALESAICNRKAQAALMHPTLNQIK